MYNDKQYHTRRLKPLKPALNPTLYQFVLWVTNQKWGYKVKYTTDIDSADWFGHLIVTFLF